MPTGAEIEAGARAIMVARYGKCGVRDWQEANWNPSVAAVVRGARAALVAAEQTRREFPADSEEKA